MDTDTDGQVSPERQQIGGGGGAGREEKRRGVFNDWLQATFFFLT